MTRPKVYDTEFPRFMLPLSLKVHAEQRAKKEGVSVAEIMRRALVEYLTKHLKTGKTDPL